MVDSGVHSSLRELLPLRELLSGSCSLHDPRGGAGIQPCHLPIDCPGDIFISRYVIHRITKLSCTHVRGSSVKTSTSPVNPSITYPLVSIPVRGFTGIII